MWVNGFLLGRYWRRGPQRTLIVPSPVTRAGRNEVVVLEFEAIADPVIRMLAAPSSGTPRSERGCEDCAGTTAVR